MLSVYITANGAAVAIQTIIPQSQEDGKAGDFRFRILDCGLYEVARIVHRRDAEDAKVCGEIIRIAAPRIMLIIHPPDFYRVILNTALTKKSQIWSSRRKVCHSERSEESAPPSTIPEDLIPHFVRNDTVLASRSIPVTFSLVRH
jgi:hypothetical protein